MNPLCSDLLFEWKEDSLSLKNFSEESSFEKFLKENLSSETKVFIYERECPFMSKETLDFYFGNVSFIQHSARSEPNTFNLRLMSGCSAKKMQYLIDGYKGDSIIRLGLLKWFFAQEFDPFQETVKRILEMKPTQRWMKAARESKIVEDRVFSFCNGELIAAF